MVPLAVCVQQAPAAQLRGDAASKPAVANYSLDGRRAATLRPMASPNAAGAAARSLRRSTHNLHNTSAWWIFLRRWDCYDEMVVLLTQVVGGWFATQSLDKNVHSFVRADRAGLSGPLDLRNASDLLWCLRTIRSYRAAASSCAASPRTTIIGYIKRRRAGSLRSCSRQRQTRVPGRRQRVQR